MRIGRTEGFSKNVRYTGAFKNSTHAASGDHTSTMSRRLDQYLRSTFFSQLIMRNSTFHHRNLDQILLRIFYAFCNSFLYFLGLTKTMTYNTIFVTNNNQGRKAESTTAFSGFHNTINCNHFLFQFEIASFYLVQVYLRHYFVN